MRQSSALTAVPGWGVVAMGVTALIAAPIALRQTAPDGWLAVWLVEALVAATIALVTMHRKAARLRTTISAQRLFLGLLPALAAGGLLTIALMWSGPVRLIPGVWLVLYGVAVVQAGAILGSRVGRHGSCLCGARRTRAAVTVVLGERDAGCRLRPAADRLRSFYREKVWGLRVCIRTSAVPAGLQLISRATQDSAYGYLPQLAQNRRDSGTPMSWAKLFRALWRSFFAVRTAPPKCKLILTRISRPYRGLKLTSTLMAAATGLP